MSSSVIPFPGPHPIQNAEEDEALTASMTAIAKEASAEQMPEILMALALQLGRALDDRQVTDGPAPETPSA